jgi:hypothetical protein
MPSNLQMARALGWTSIAIGVTEIAATRWLEEQMGVDDHHVLIRAFGVREIAAGVTLLSQPGLNKTLVGGLWGRVAGDAADIAALTMAVPSTRNPRGLGAVMGLVLAVTGVDVVVALGAQRNLTRAAAVSEAARRRVQPTSALPKGAPQLESRALGTVAAASV